MDVIKQNDTWPYLEFNFIDASGNPVDCSNFEVSLVVRNYKKVVTIEATLNDASGAVWTDRQKGFGEYRWQEIDTRIQGRFQYEFKFIDTINNRKFTLPTIGYFEYEVNDDVIEDV
jgi:hypothetical protein